MTHGNADIQDKGHAIVKQGLLKPQLFPNRAGPQKDAIDLVYIKKWGGLTTTNFLRPFVRG